MTQHDFVIDNGPGLAVRTDINAAMQALLSMNAGPVAPDVTYANMLWLDTSVSPPGLRLRDPGNDSWNAPLVFFGVLSTTGVFSGKRISSDTGYFLGNGATTILSNEVGGNIILRPKGYADNTGQAYLTPAGDFYATRFRGNGTYLTGLNASQLTAGTVPSARLSGTYNISVSGSSGSATNATNCTRQVVAGNGLTGGGQLTADRTLRVGGGTGITVSADAISVSADVWRDGNMPSAGQIGNVIASMSAGTKGSFGFLRHVGSGALSPGTNVAGSNLRWANGGGAAEGGAPSGTWRLMGYVASGSTNDAGEKSSLYLRYA